MTEVEAIEKLRAYHKCKRLQVKGIYEDCNEGLCDNCDLCYAQGNTGEHIKSIEIAINALEQSPKMEQFAKWVATEIFDDMWEYNKDSFAEIACRKLAKLGIVRAKGDEWELVESQESEEV